MKPTFTNDLPECLPVIWVLGHGLAEIPTLTRPIVYNQSQMVSSDAATDGRSTFLHSFDSCASGSVLEDDAEFREGFVDLEEVGEEGGLGIEDVDVLADL